MSIYYINSISSYVGSVPVQRNVFLFVQRTESEYHAHLPTSILKASQFNPAPSKNTPSIFAAHFNYFNEKALL